MTSIWDKISITFIYDQMEKCSWNLHSCTWIQIDFLEVCADRPTPDCFNNEATKNWNNNNKNCDRAKNWCSSSSYGPDARHCCPLTCGECTTAPLTCTCANGTPVTGSACRGEEQCESCSSGFVGEQCIPEPICTCVNGVAAEYPDCTVDGQEKCASCNDGWMGDNCDEVKRLSKKPSTFVVRIMIL